MSNHLVGHVSRDFVRTFNKDGPNNATKAPDVNFSQISKTFSNSDYPSYHLRLHQEFTICQLFQLKTFFGIYL